jgi:ribosome-associated protein
MGKNFEHFKLAETFYLVHAVLGTQQKNMNTQQIQKELKFRTSRSSGSGGQNVNKVETRVEALFEIDTSEGLDEAEKATLRQKLAKRISKEGLLSTSSQESRLQQSNRDKAIKKILDLIETALVPEPEREEVPERLVANPKKRKKAKSVQSDKKAGRKKIIPPPKEED